MTNNNYKAEQSMKNHSSKFPSMTSKTNSGETKSELATEILSSEYGFLEKWAILLSLAVLIVLFSLGLFIRYPDTIEVEATLTAKTAPKEIVIREQGRLVKLFTANGKRVHPGAVIGWVESVADHEEVIALSNEVRLGVGMYNINDLEHIASLFTKPYFNLGELQISYQNFKAAWQNFNDYTKYGFYTSQKKRLAEDLSLLNKKEKLLTVQRGLTDEDVKIAEESYQMNKDLLDEKVLTKEEFRNQSSKFISKKQILPQLNTALLDIEAQKLAVLNELNKIEHDEEQVKGIFLQNLESLNSQVEAWKKKYILLSPIAGHVYFTLPLQENQYLTVGKIIGFVNPDENNFYLESLLPQNNFGRLNVGQSVQIRFDAYPYQEYGPVRGKISYISKVPSDGGFRAFVQLSNGLVTDNHKRISYKSGLKARAIIITKDIRLFERIYYSLVKSTSIEKL